MKFFITFKNFLECILVLLREDGDDQPLILQTKLILNEALNPNLILTTPLKRGYLGLQGSRKFFSFFNVLFNVLFGQQGVACTRRNEWNWGICHFVRTITTQTIKINALVNFLLFYAQIIHAWFLAYFRFWYISMK